MAGPPVGPLPAMQAAGHPVVPEVSAGGDHLRLDGVVSLPVDLAEIRRLAGSHQGLEPAAGGRVHMISIWRSRQQAAFIVLSAVRHRAVAQGFASAPDAEGSSSTGSDRGGKGRSRTAFRARCTTTKRSPPSCEAAASAGPGRGAWVRYSRARGNGRRSGLLEISAGKWSVASTYRSPSPVPQLVKGDASGVAEEPGGLVIERGDAVLERSHPQGDTEGHGTGSPVRGREGLGR